MTIKNEPKYRKESDYRVKTFQADDIKIIEDSGKFYFEGYANTKNKPDSYGDVPTNYNGQPVYDLSRFKKNPSLFINHETDVECTAGTFIELKEDETGLYFRCLLQRLEDCDLPKLRQAVRNCMNGISRALSIGGRWYFDDPKNPTHLTRAYIYEISLAGVGADEDALTNVAKPKSFDSNIDKPNRLRENQKDLGVIKLKLSTLI